MSNSMAVLPCRCSFLLFSKPERGIATCVGEALGLLLGDVLGLALGETDGLTLGLDVGCNVGGATQLVVPGMPPPPPPGAIE